MSIRKSFFALAAICSALMGLFAAFFYFSSIAVNSFNFLAVTGHHWAQVQRIAVSRLNQYLVTENEEQYQMYLRNLKLSSLLKSARTGTLKETPNLYIDGNPVVNDPNDFRNLQELSGFLNQYGQQGSLKEVVEKWSEGDNKMATLNDLAIELRDDINQKNLIPEKKEYYRLRLEKLDSEFTNMEKDFFGALAEAHTGFGGIVFWLNWIVYTVLIGVAGIIAFFISRPILRDLSALREVAMQIENNADIGEIPFAKTTDFYFLVEALGRMRERLMLEGRDRERAQNMAGLGAWKWQPSSHIMTWSRKVFEILNLPVGLGPSYEAFRDRVHPEDRAIFDNLLQKDSYSEIKELLVEIRIVCNFGGRWQIRYCHFLVEAQQNEFGPVISGTIQDITDRINSEGKAS